MSSLQQSRQVLNNYLSPSPSYEFIDDERDMLCSTLVAWFKTNHRSLPWRNDPNCDSSSPGVSPYGVWVSESMLQQTRVETVIPYWVKWMDAFPTIESLSKASPEEVNKLWAGLGYYRRAQQLRQGAQFVMDKFHGQLPDKVELLREISGIGPYTAGAISSIAFGKPEAIVDGES